MVDLYNATGILGQVISSTTATITGDLFLTLLLVFLFFIAITMYFGIPIEVTGIIILPICILLMAATSSFLPYGVIVLFFVSFISVKYLFILR
jgi:hypothetical protein